MKFIPSLVLCSILMFFSGVMPAQKLSKKEKKKKEHYAYTYFLAGEYENAKKEYSELKKLYPEEAKFDYWLGVTSLRSIHDEEALAFLIKAKNSGYTTDQKPTLIYDDDFEEWVSTDLDFNLARAYHINEQFDKAKISYNVVLDKMVHLYHGHHHDKEMDALKHYIDMCNNGRKLISAPVEGIVITNLGPELNTEHRETSPVVSADEKTIIFTSRRPGNTGNTIDGDGLPTQDIYISNKEGGKWSEPKQISSNINTDEHDACVAISPDGHSLILYKNNNHLTGDLYLSELNGETWSSPEKMSFCSRYFERNASISADEKLLVFSSDRPGGLGGLDIWYCYKEDNKWSEPINAGPSVNTIYNDDAPYIHPSGHTLYFSSKGHTSMGGYDIFKSEFFARTRKFGKAKNLGYPINGTEDDIFFVWSPDGKRAYFSSHHKDSYGDQDLYMMEVPQAEEPVILLYGFITSALNNTPVHARISVTNNETGELIGLFDNNSHTGKYTIVLPPGNDYGIYVEALNFLPQTKNVTLVDKNKYYEEEVDFSLQTLKKGSVVVLNNVFFENDKSVLSKKSNAELDKFVKMMKNNEDVFIEIAGHTELGGREDQNKKLSQSRANQVRDYFLRRGIDEKRLHPIGYGDHYPITLMKTDVEKKKNRRVEIIVHDAKKEGNKWTPYYSDKLSRSEARETPKKDK